MMVWDDSIKFVLVFIGRSMDKIKADAAEKGDLGLVAEVKSFICLPLLPILLPYMRTATPINGEYTY